MNKTRTIKEVRGSWADSRRAIFLLENEIERSYKKDPVGAELLRKMVVQPIKRLLDIIDEPISKGDEIDFALALAGLNNYNAETFKRKLNIIMPNYKRLMAEKDIDVELVERRRVIAKLVPPGGKSA